MQEDKDPHSVTDNQMFSRGANIMGVIILNEKRDSTGTKTWDVIVFF